MTVLHVTIVARQRLAIGVASEVSYATAGHDFVPGSVLRGALAAAWIADHGPPQHSPHHGQFQRLFDADIRYGPLHPEGSSRMPLSVYMCKYPTTPVCAAVAVDQVFEPIRPCDGCGRRLTPSQGILLLPDEITVQRSVRTAIGPDGRAVDGQLFATAALPAGITLSGTIHGHHPWLAGRRDLRLGGRRTVSGHADYTTRPGTVAAAHIGDTTAHIMLTSPAVFVDTAGSPRPTPDPQLDLRPGLALGHSWTRLITWHGWHAASRLPKPAELCAAAGSVFTVTGPADQLTAWVQYVLEHGIGLRRTEGFGVVTTVTAPWTPPHRIPPPPPPADPLQAPLNELTSLGLSTPQRRWLHGAMRALQIEHHRPAPDTTGDANPAPASPTAVTAATAIGGAADGTLDALLRQPTARDMTGSQRHRIQTLLSQLGPDDLRDLTTLYAARTPEPS